LAQLTVFIIGGTMRAHCVPEGSSRDISSYTTASAAASHRMHSRQYRDVVASPHGST
jgi:hypothetical protein